VLRVDYPYGVVAGPDGAVYVSQRLRHRVLRIEPDGRIIPVAGCGRGGGRGDGGPALDAELDNPCGLALGRDGALFVADSFTNRIRRVGVDGRIDTVAGSGRPGPPPGPVARAATLLDLSHPHDVCLDAQGRLHVANTGGHQVIRIDPDGRAAPLAGAGTPGLSGDHGPAQLAQLRRPHAVVAVGETTYLADTDNHLVRAVDPDGAISTAAGRFYGASPDEDAPAQIADVGRPQALAATATGDLLLAAPDAGRVRVLTTDRRVRTFADARTGLQRPLGLTVLADGTVAVADTARHLLHLLPPNHHPL
jgi:serine/threonine-protein kinase